MHGMTFKNVGGACVARVQGLMDYIAWNQLMTASSTGDCQEWADEMAGTRNGGLEWPEMPELGPLDPKDGRCPGSYASLYHRLERSIFYMNRVLICCDPSKNISRGYLPPWFTPLGPLMSSWW